MQKKLLNQLLTISYKENTLQKETVLKIADHLDKKDLREYIRALKLIEKKKTVVITVPKGSAFSEKEALQKIFSGKKIAVETDPDLLLGVKIQDDDNIYEMNLKNTLDNLVTYIKDYE